MPTSIIAPNFTTAREDTVNIADDDIITARYFFPRDASPDNVELVDVGDAELACHHADSGHELTVIHFHGNGEVVADYVPGFAQQFDQLGTNTFFAEYRGYGGSTGTPRLGAMLDDVDAIRRAVDAPDDRIVVFGRSIGSIYAIEFASRFPDVGGLVLESGIADVLERILLRVEPEALGTTRQAMETEFSRLFDHRDKLGSYGGPTLVMHAIGDHLVDYSHAERNAEWAGGDTRLVGFERGNHNTIFPANQTAYLEELRQFFEAIAA